MSARHPPAAAGHPEVNGLTPVSGSAQQHRATICGSAREVGLQKLKSILTALSAPQTAPRSNPTVEGTPSRGGPGYHSRIAAINTRYPPQAAGSYYDELLCPSIVAIEQPPATPPLTARPCQYWGLREPLNQAGAQLAGGNSHNRPVQDFSSRLPQPGTPAQGPSVGPALHGPWSDPTAYPASRGRAHCSPLSTGAAPATAPLFQRDLPGRVERPPVGCDPEGRGPHQGSRTPRPASLSQVNPGRQPQ
ncbi:hypothetical protein NDU88_001950 [Pleurodeles waltl]|uniref:Uncharacterized protein n=1 Tax=Pleurodeles waltl TaxID=8319 RepID=A0AAV7MW08_PLEWA|nr:hypothetical protein NDU88_001950 [Pleurodeles waltl]